MMVHPFAVCALALSAALAAMPSRAAEFICSVGGARLYAEADADATQASAATSRRFATTGIKARGRLTRQDLEQAYSGQPVLLGSTWLMVYMLPASDPGTRDALADLGVSPSAAERMAKSTGLVDRGIRLAKNADDMVDKVANSHPAAGYVAYNPGVSSVRPCF
jgi:hypothetical protein